MYRIVAIVRVSKTLLRQTSISESILFHVSQILSCVTHYRFNIHRLYHKTPIKMVEGHQCHRVAHFHRQKLVGKTFSAVSPNGRFIEGAERIHMKTLQRIECHGKNLFYMFDSRTMRKGLEGTRDNQTINDNTSGMAMKDIAKHENNGEKSGSGDDVVVMHVHFGMSGRFGIYSLPYPEPKPTVRLILTNEDEGIAAYLSAMTVQHGDMGKNLVHSDFVSSSIWHHTA